MDAWDNGSSVPQDSLRAAQIEGISRRMVGMVRSASKLPTYRKRFRQVVKDLIAHALEKQDIARCNSRTHHLYTEKCFQFICDVKVQLTRLGIENLLL
ncbi:hypothetical protein CRYUN_Cryun24cG0066200 [Craigia yunnanensis]